jgi:hypothetical protein
MKTSDFKKILKESIREVFQEELKEILLEAVKSPKPMVMETRNQLNNPPPPNPLIDKYRGMMEDEISFSTQDITPPTPSYNVDPINGVLPSNSVRLDDILSLIK